MASFSARCRDSEHEGPRIGRHSTVVKSIGLEVGVGCSGRVLRKNAFDLRRLAAIQNLETIARRERLRRAT